MLQAGVTENGGRPPCQEGGDMPGSGIRSGLPETNRPRAGIFLKDLRGAGQIRKSEEVADQTVRQMLVRGKMSVRDMVRTLDALRVLGIRRRMMMEGRQQEDREDDSQQEDGICLSFAHHRQN